MKKQTKVIVLFSGGLDSRLVIKILQEQGLEIEAVQFKLPFGCKICKEEKDDFIKREKIKIVEFDCTKGKLFEEYLKIIKKPKHGFGTGINPCIDCRIFIINKTKEYADKRGITIIASGEVLGERPMSQTSKNLQTIDEETGIEILRPLSAKLLAETSFEKDKLVGRNNFFEINGRSRKIQLELAKKYKIKYPTPSGGCLLCEKILAKRLKFLLEKNLINEQTLELTKIGRPFFIDGYLFVVGRKEKENFIIETFSSSLKSTKEKPAVCYIGPDNLENKNKAKELQEAYSTGSINEREKFEKFKI
jgi:predicted subunit of tRNA(5-methylaminomethyl-2-thiouridylate) methyltransferase